MVLTLMVDEREVLGRGILHRLSELKKPKFFNNFTLFLGKDIRDLLIHKVASKNLKGETLHEDFLINPDGELYCIRNSYMNIFNHDEIDESPIFTRIRLNEPKDFLKVSYEAALSLNRAVTDETFFDDLAWRLNNQDKPGYRNVWSKNVQNEIKKSLKARNPEEPFQK